ncbi:hypothetical protein J5Y04_05825 [Kitasatospora sp. RG8]|uniref:hypothetical protein n=1 Tax=Kitasatospora sp. RG8 TaxID=2820815 RepID=UPI001ADFA51C|nr:hypothetical protein [Kitasatospora sp. RG8]MBP0449062.1 hypothetical protein [Kitasatospora sp. RG8]
MDENEAQQMANTLRRLGIRGIVSPEDLSNPDGQWRVYDSSDPAARRDITDEVLTVVKGMSRTTGGPTRGFVVRNPR